MAGPATAHGAGLRRSRHVRHDDSTGGLVDFRRGRGSEPWRNEFAARVTLTFGFYRPGLKVKHLKMPLLMCVCDQDATTPMAAAVKAAERAPRAELRHYPYGHFDIYLDPRVKADQVAFLQRTVQGVSA